MEGIPTAWPTDLLRLSDPLRLSERVLRRRAQAVLLHNVRAVHHLFRRSRRHVHAGICGVSHC